MLNIDRYLSPSDQLVEPALLLEDITFARWNAGDLYIISNNIKRTT